MPAKRKKTPASDGNKRRRVSDKGGKQKKKGKKKGGADDEVEEVCGTDFVFCFPLLLLLRDHKAAVPHYDQPLHC